MAEGIKIEVFRMKNAEELTTALADPDGRLETGSGAALCAALASALLCRAARETAKETENERVDYIVRNGEILRKYMVHLIDEDVKARGPLKRALREGGAYEIEASRQPAIAICGEIINMMHQALELTQELSSVCPKSALHHLGESAELAMAAIRSARLYILDMADKSTDDTYRFVVRRENEITLEQCTALASAVSAAAEAAV